MEHPDIPAESILLIPDAAIILKCSEGYVRRLIHENKIHAYKVGKTYRIPRECLIDYLDSLIPIPSGKTKSQTKKSLFNQTYSGTIHRDCALCYFIAELRHPFRSTPFSLQTQIHNGGSDLSECPVLAARHRNFSPESGSKRTARYPAEMTPRPVHAP